MLPGLDGRVQKRLPPPPRAHTKAARWLVLEHMHTAPADCDTCVVASQPFVAPPAQARRSLCPRVCNTRGPTDTPDMSYCAHLWCDVVGGPELLAEPLAWLAELACAKVNELQLRAVVPAGQQYVLGLQVPAGRRQHMTHRRTQVTPLVDRGQAAAACCTHHMLRMNTRPRRCCLPLCCLRRLPPPYHAHVQAPRPTAPAFLGLRCGKCCRCLTCA